MEKVRLQKIISDNGICSRRKAEELIAQGRVKVNGRPVKVGDKADPSKDLISIDGEPIRIERRRTLRYIMLNKPRGYVTTMSDELDRKNVTELLTGVGDRVYPIGRLDKNSEGLLLFTNDGKLANDIMHPSKHITKTYRVTVRPDIDDETLVKLAEGVVIDGRKTLPCTVIVLEKQQGRVVLQMTISEGRNRQIRKMCEAVGLEVARLKRTSVGPVRLGMLKPGEWRDLKPDELRALRTAIEKGNSSKGNS
ncbi:23S rRNA pseudouridine2605 synthase [Ruminococcus sp. YE71]|uniref:pseudouridine synthase n=1 Tax=unclassified Ruminococcus TaxID=2608920 RepID=UPI00088178D3|nr:MULTISPECIES: pseudouridine synthase [unclassified Ruminococcus]SDA15694.1 23S rRNA pseudouridine2605 synthase [Ruminococcus sp. YE78]SFW23013.1 23S rRNA pseudouridine2605 synthase [Ruminococcus sp. YE71]